MNTEERAAAYRKVFMTDEGRAVLTDLLRFAQVLTVHWQPDARQQERLNGQKDMGLYILESLGILDSYDNLTTALLSVPARPTEIQQEADSE